jgi:signal transduction histidine kinase
MLIQDDGVGLKPDAFLAHQRGHFGLASMRERADLIGGRLNVNSARGKGTAITLMLPARIAYVTPQSWLRRLLSRFN